MITNGMEQLCNLLANDTPLQPYILVSMTGIVKAKQRMRKSKAEGGTGGNNKQRHKKKQPDII